MSNFDLTPDLRKQVASHVFEKLETYLATNQDLPVSKNWNQQGIKKFIDGIDLNHPNPSMDVIDHLIKGLTDFAVHTPHPSYFGLFNPRSNFLSAIGDFIVALFNPQLAAWSHAPFANELERSLINAFGKYFGYPPHQLDGTFCSGGAESNLTALICALNDRFPNFKYEGLFGLNQLPIIYCSSESHHSIQKAAKIVGLGIQSVRSILVKPTLGLDTEALKDQIKKDKAAGHLPFMIVGTAGTTGAGAMDELPKLAEIAQNENLWFHVDAAYGGAAIISKKHRPILKGIELSDSITLDIHKWFSVPMGASIFFTSRPHVLHQSFSITTNYMPKEETTNDIINPYVHSIQWSRRLMGMKLFLPLAVHGWEGYEKTIDHHFEMGALLKQKLLAHQWVILNHSPLPIYCFTHPKLTDQNIDIQDFVDRVNQSGSTWISTFPVHGETTIRACITNFATTPKEVDDLIKVLMAHLDQVSK